METAQSRSFTSGHWLAITTLAYPVFLALLWRVFPPPELFPGVSLLWILLGIGVPLSALVSVLTSLVMLFRSPNGGKTMALVLILSGLILGFCVVCLYALVTMPLIIGA